MAYFTIAHRTADNNTVLSKSVANAVSYFIRSGRKTVSVANIVDLLCGDLPMRLHDRITYDAVKAALRKIASDTRKGYKYHVIGAYVLHATMIDAYDIVKR